MPKTLLLADDSVTIQKVVGISLANEDIQLVTVENGDDAVARAQESRPDIVLADIVMPGKNGYEVCETIKNDPKLAGVPVLLLTGTFEAFDAQRARDVGADGHITKPFEAQALVDQVNQLLARSAPLQNDGVEAAPAAEAASAAPSAPSEEVAVAAAASAPSGDAFDFFDEGDAGRPGAWSPPEPGPEAADLDDASPFGGIDLGQDTVPSVTPGAADDTVLLDTTRASADPAFDAAVEAAAFDAPGERPEASFGEGEDSGFDLEMSDLSMASTVPEVPGAEQAGPAPDLTFSEGAPPAADPLADFGAVDEAGAPVVHGPEELAGPASPVDPDTTVMPSDAPVATAPDFTATTVPDLAAETGPDPVSAGTHEGARPGAAEEAPAAELTADVTEPLSEAVSAPRAPGPAEAPAPMVEDADPSRVQGGPGPEPAGPAAPAAGAPALSPEQWQQIQATLEKIAWEALGDLSEQVVKQALDRVEAIAWEVIPRMAETLIREEIERMQGGEDPEGA